MVTAECGASLRGSIRGPVPSHLSPPRLRTAMYLASWCPSVSPLKEMGTPSWLGPGPRRPRSRLSRHQLLAACAPLCLQLTARRSAGSAGRSTGPAPAPVKAIAVTGVPPARSVQRWFCRVLPRGRRFSRCKASGRLGIQATPAGPSVTPPLTLCSRGPGVRLCRWRTRATPREDAPRSLQLSAVCLHPTHLTRAPSTHCS